MSKRHRARRAAATVDCVSWLQHALHVITSVGRVVLPVRYFKRDS